MPIKILINTKAMFEKYPILLFYFAKVRILSTKKYNKSITNVYGRCDSLAASVYICSIKNRLLVTINYMKKIILFIALTLFFPSCISTKLTIQNIDDNAPLRNSPETILLLLRNTAKT
jgi:hypothetical protein